MSLSTALAAEPLPQFRITYLAINESENTLELHCTFQDLSWSEALANDEAKWSLAITEPGQHFEDVIIKKSVQISPTAFVLYVQPPLSSSMYAVKKRTFVLSYVEHDEVYQTQRDAVLGSSLRHFDLRPYTSASKAATLLAIFGIVGLLSVFLWMITPLAQKYRFKKKHITKYVTDKDTEDLDPFTFLTLQEGDDIVTVEDQKMLLSSWKTINKLAIPKLTEAHQLFFKEKLEGSFLNPKTSRFKMLNRAWYGLLGIATGWLLNLGISDELLKPLAQSLFVLFDSETLQTATLITRETVLGSCVGLCYGLALALCDVIQNLKFVKGPFFKAVLLRTAVITMGFLIQASITAFLIPHFYVAIGFNWLVLGLAFSCATPDGISKLNVLSGLWAGIFTAAAFLLLSHKMSVSYMGVSVALFIGMLMLAGLVAAFKWRKIKAKDEIRRLSAYSKKAMNKIQKKKSKKTVNAAVKEQEEPLGAIEKASSRKGVKQELEEVL